MARDNTQNKSDKTKKDKTTPGLTNRPLPTSGKGGAQGNTPAATPPPTNWKNKPDNQT